MKLEVRNGSFSYCSKTILDEISFDVSSGEILCVLGSNGVGKTTLLKCMMGFNKWDKGETLIDGVNINSIRDNDLWKIVSYVPQAKASTFAFTALDMVMMGCSSHLSLFLEPGKKEEEKALQAMDECGILWLKDKLCTQMSGGELQMVLIARALTSDTKLLVLDEPESNLDFKNQLVILDVIQKLTREKKICAIVNTHFPSHAMKIGTKALILNKNDKSLFGFTQDIINVPNMRKSFDVQVQIHEFDYENCHYKSVEPLYVV